MPVEALDDWSFAQMSLGELALTESRTLREQHMSHTEVLDRVKSLTMLADDVHATTEIVAAYFEVDIETIKKLIQRHRDEMILNGYRVLKGDELRELKRDNVSLLDAKSLALFTKRTMLNIGQLLTGSKIAQAVRTRLLDDHETARKPVSDLIPAGAPVAQAEEATAIIRMLAVGLPVALCAQNGATADDLPWDYIDVVFLAGIVECPPCSFVPDVVDLPMETCPAGHRLTEWKTSPVAAAITAEAKARGLWVHMGRVNTRGRMLAAKRMGCDSADGTFLAYGPDQNLPRLLGWLCEPVDLVPQQFTIFDLDLEPVA